MELFVASLAVYKTVQVLDSLSPKEAMPWVKILVGIALGYASVFILSLEHKPVMGLTVAACAGIVHTVLRLITLVGDVARKRSIR
jgi:hypothetical protein